MQFNIKMRSKGFYRVQKIGKDGNVKFDNEFGNVLTYIFGDEHLSGGNRGLAEYSDIVVGTDNTNPAPTQTSLQTQVGSVDVSSFNKTANTTDMYTQAELYGEFSVGSLDGYNLTELGVENPDFSGIISRQLFRAIESVTGENLATGDGTTVSYDVNTSGDYLDPGTIQITSADGSGNTLTVNDDGAGNLTGDVDSGGTNTVDYETGQLTWTFSTAPGDQEPIDVAYDWNAPTSISMTADDGLRIWYYIRVYFDNASATGLSFTLNTDSGDVTVNYDVSLSDNLDQFIRSQALRTGSYTGSLGELEAHDSGGLIAGVDYSSKTLTSASNNSGVSQVDITYLFPDSTFSGQTIEKFESYSVFQFPLHSDSYIESMESTEELEINLRVELEVNR